jgi:hypothetical protein
MFSILATALINFSCKQNHSESGSSEKSTITVKCRNWNITIH